MKQAILTQFPWPWLTVVALLIFFTFFVGLLIVLGRRSAKPLYQAAASIPLHEGDEINQGSAQ